MCGRYSLLVSPSELKERFQVKIIEGEFSANYNATPSQQLPLITNHEPEKIILAQWGMVPAWMKDEKSPKRLINARVETIDQKKTFKSAAKKRRCLVIADGFYEWAQVPGQKIKQPYRIIMKDNSPFAMAGIYNNKMEFAIITVQANALMAKIHNRMPAILSKPDEKRWLDPTIDLKQAILMLRPYPADKIKAYPVSLDINSVKNNNVKLIDELPTQKPLI